MTDLRVLRGGAEGSATVLMLHGLGATADVWAGLAEELEPVTWIAPDLPGHGRSGRLDAYAFAAVADAVADLVDPRGTVVIGHSFGGVIALHLAGRPGVRAVIGLGIKVAWTAEELDRAAALAAREPQTFPDRGQAVARHLRVAGLDGLLDPAGPLVDAGVTEAGGGWRPSFDSRAFGVGDPAVAELLTAARAPVVLARGEHDPMVSQAQLAALVSDPVDLPGLGHNAHVENPRQVAGLLSPWCPPAE